MSSAGVKLRNVQLGHASVYAGDEYLGFTERGQCDYEDDGQWWWFTYARPVPNGGIPIVGSYATRREAVAALAAYEQWDDYTEVGDDGIRRKPAGQNP